MSVNQSRGDKNEPPHYRRSGRSANFSSGGGGRGGGTTGPSSAYYFGKSFKKVVSNAQEDIRMRICDLQVLLLVVVELH
ncbi:hypothetical protein Hanom_Chr05g00460171 [Helianthus anomalus]